jgi:hypothetical protein
MTNLNESQTKERCHYCDKPGAYWDYLSYALISVCKYHLKNYHTS